MVVLQPPLIIIPLQEEAAIGLIGIINIFFILNRMRDGAMSMRTFIEINDNDFYKIDQTLK